MLQPAPSWTGATEPSLGEGSGDTLSSLGDGEGSAEVNTMLIDRHRVANDDAQPIAHAGARASKHRAEEARLGELRHAGVRLDGGDAPYARR